VVVERGCYDDDGCVGDGLIGTDCIGCILYFVNLRKLQKENFGIYSHILIV